MPNRENKTGKAENFSPKNKGICIDGDWYTVADDKWRFVSDIEKGDEVEFGTNPNDEIVFIQKANGGSSKNRNSNKMVKNAQGSDEIIDKLDAIESIVAKNYDENSEIIRGIKEDVVGLQQEITVLKEALDIKEE